MVAYSYTLAQLLLLSSAVHALPELAITKKRHADVNPARLRKRQNEGNTGGTHGGTVGTNVYDVLTWSTGGAYYANVTVGTPPQDQVVILDTGSSDLYFDASTASSCESTGPYSCRGGTFDHSKSSSYNVVAQSPAFNTSFGDGSTAVGPFASDFVGIGDVMIDGVQFGVAEEVNSTTGYAIGLMGVGYSENEATRHQYPNMPEVLKTAGVINSRLYSVYLNDVGQTSGSILFGGIDKSKYTGDMVTLDLLPDAVTSQVDQFISVVTDLSATVGGKTSQIFSDGSSGIAAYSRSDSSLPVLLDTGSSAWSVPEDYYNQGIAPVFTYVDQQGACSCEHRDSDDSITLTFGGEIKITVPAREFIAPLYNSTTNEPVPYDTAGNQACVFMITPASPTGEGFQTLGDAVLRSMYVVFDLDNGQVSLAQAAVNSTSQPNIVTVQAGPSGVASAVSVASSAPTQTYSVAAAVDGTASFSVSTAQSTIGTATGVNAVPEDARPSGGSGSGSGGSGGGSGSGSGSGTSSSAAASALTVPGVDIGVLGSLAVMGVMTVAGAALML